MSKLRFLFIVLIGVFAVVIFTTNFSAADEVCVESSIDCSRECKGPPDSRGEPTDCDWVCDTRSYCGGSASEENRGGGGGSGNECRSDSDCPNSGSAVYDSTGCFCGNCNPDCDNGNCQSCGCGSGGGYDYENQYNYESEYSYQYQYQYQTPSVDIKADGLDSRTIDYGRSVNLSWSSSNVNTCNASGDWGGNKGTSGSQSTGSLTGPRSYSYSLTCPGQGGSASDSVGVNVNAPQPPSLSSVNLTEPNYCRFGPGGTVSWSYSDPQSSGQNGYRVQVIEQSSSSTVQDSCPSGSGCSGGSSTSYSIPLGTLSFNTRYYSRVMVWNSLGLASPWVNMSSCSGQGCSGTNWLTPPHAYPRPSFTYSPASPVAKIPVQFTDATTYSDGGTGTSWNWDFSDSPTSTLKNPTHAFNNGGTYLVTLTATDNDGHTCTNGRSITVSSTKPFPKWKEILPF